MKADGLEADGLEADGLEADALEADALAADAFGEAGLACGALDDAAFSGAALAGAAFVAVGLAEVFAVLLGITLLLFLENFSTGALPTEPLVVGVLVACFFELEVFELELLGAMLAVRAFFKVAPFTLACLSLVEDLRRPPAAPRLDFAAADFEPLDNFLSSEALILRVFCDTASARTSRPCSCFYGEPNRPFSGCVRVRRLDCAQNSTIPVKINDLSPGASRSPANAGLGLSFRAPEAIFHA